MTYDSVKREVRVRLGSVLSVGVHIHSIGCAEMLPSSVNPLNE